MSAIAAMTDPAAASGAGRLRGRHGPHTSSAVPVRARHTAVLTAGLPGTLLGPLT